MIKSPHIGSHLARMGAVIWENPISSLLLETFTKKASCRLKKPNQEKSSTQQWSANRENYHPEQMDARSKDSHTE